MSRFKFLQHAARAFSSTTRPPRAMHIVVACEQDHHKDMVETVMHNHGITSRVEAVKAILPVPSSDKLLAETDKFGKYMLNYAIDRSPDADLHIAMANATKAGEEQHSQRLNATSIQCHINGQEERTSTNEMRTVDVSLSTDRQNEAMQEAANHHLFLTLNKALKPVIASINVAQPSPDMGDIVTKGWTSRLVKQRTPSEEARPLNIIIAGGEPEHIKAVEELMKGHGIAAKAQTQAVCDYEEMEPIKDVVFAAMVRTADQAQAGDVYMAIRNGTRHDKYGSRFDNIDIYGYIPATGKNFAAKLMVQDSINTLQKTLKVALDPVLGHLKQAQGSPTQAPFARR